MGGGAGGSNVCVSGCDPDPDGMILLPRRNEEDSSKRSPSIDCAIPSLDTALDKVPCDALPFKSCVDLDTLDDAPVIIVIADEDEDEDDKDDVDDDVDDEDDGADCGVSFGREVGSADPSNFLLRGCRDDVVALPEVELACRISFRLFADSDAISRNMNCSNGFRCLLLPPGISLLIHFQRRESKKLDIKGAQLGS